MILTVTFAILLTFTSINYIYYFQLFGYNAKKYSKGFRTENMVVTLISLCFFVLSLILNLCGKGVAENMVTYTYACVLASMGVYFLLKKRKINIKYTHRVVRLLVTLMIVVIAIILPLAIVDKVFNPIFPLLGTMLPMLVLLCAFINLPIEFFIRSLYKKKSIAKLNEINPIVIAITGSYGKTSVKSVICDIIGSTIKTYCTPHSYNTPMGICKAIEEMPLDTKVFIVEFGARKSGDIAELCKMTHPVLGVIVGINNQHVETFGSIENTAKTKCELSDYLAEKNCTAIVGGDGANAELLISSVRSKMICVTGNQSNVDFLEKCALKYGKTMKGYIAVDNYEGDEFGSVFSLLSINNAVITEEIPYLRSKLLGEHNAFNIALAIAVAKQFGLTTDEIIRGVVNTKPIPHRLEIIKNGGLIIIDDTYNSNADGFMCALKTLKNYNNKGKKVVITAGVVELGAEQYKTNFSLCEKIASCADEVIIIGQTNKKAFCDGLAAVAYPLINTHCAKTLDDSAKLFSTLLQAGDCILFENDLPDNYK